MGVWLVLRDVQPRFEAEKGQKWRSILVRHVEL